MNNNTRYTTQRIDASVLSVLDLNLDGKVVSAEKWNALWNLVISKINNIDTFCTALDDVLHAWDNSAIRLNEVIEEFNHKYEALNDGFVHYGTAAPTNKFIRMWVQPVENVIPHSIVLQHTLDTALQQTVLDSWEEPV